MDICFVLVRPAVPENVGACARALKTMGFSRLRVVASDAHRDKAARILAHGAGDVLDGIETCDDLGAALADVDFSIATSARERHGRRYSLTPPQLRADLDAKRGSVARVAIVFGCEESGLSNAELDACDALSAIPLAVSHPSLNLGQAVMLYAYELSQCALEADVELPAAADWAALKRRVAALLDRVDVPAEGKLREWTLARLPFAAHEDVGFLHMLCRHLEEHLGG